MGDTPRFIRAMYVAMIGLRYFLSFMQNTLWRKQRTWTAPRPPLYSSAKMFHAFIQSRPLQM